MLLANRLPDVELLTASGRGVPMLAVSYATQRSLTLTPLVADFRVTTPASDSPDADSLATPSKE
jgi:hypothetical protein